MVLIRSRVCTAPLNFLLLTYLVGRYSAQQIPSTERRFQSYTFNMHAESLFQSSAPHMLIKFPHFFTQTSVEALLESYTGGSKADSHCN